MGCSCGGARKPRGAGQSLGYEVTYPDGRKTPADQPFLTLAEARHEVIISGGGTIRKLIRS